MSLFEELLAERGIKIIRPSENKQEQEYGDYETDCKACKLRNQTVEKEAD